MIAFSKKWNISASITLPIKVNTNGGHFLNRYYMYLERQTKITERPVFQFGNIFNITDAFRIIEIIRILLNKFSSFSKTWKLIWCVISYNCKPKWKPSCLFSFWFFLKTVSWNRNILMMLNNVLVVQNYLAYWNNTVCFWRNEQTAKYCLSVSYHIVA